MALSNSQYNTIMRLYNERQFQNKYEQDRRVKEVYERLPQIRQIDEEVSTQAAACARRLLDGDTKARAALKQRLEDLREQKAALLEAGGYKPDYLEMHYHCPVCQDTGYVNGKKCRCLDRKSVV